MVPVDPEAPVFIVLEGLDGAGTTTQSARLASWLEARGRGVHVTREPSTGPVGVLIRQILNHRWSPFDPAALGLLFAGDRLDHVAREIQPQLDAGNDVISDRYVLSSLAYQGRSGNLPWVETINERALTPDLTIFLDVPVSVCLARLEGRSGEAEIFEREDSLVEIDAMYRQILQNPPANLVAIDGSSSIDLVFESVVGVLYRRFGWS